MQTGKTKSSQVKIIYMLSCTIHLRQIANYKYFLRIVPMLTCYTMHYDVQLVRMGYRSFIHGKQHWSWPLQSSIKIHIQLFQTYQANQSGVYMGVYIAWPREGERTLVATNMQVYSLLSVGSGFAVWYPNCVLFCMSVTPFILTYFC